MAQDLRTEPNGQGSETPSPGPSRPTHSRSTKVLFVLAPTLLLLSAFLVTDYLVYRGNVLGGVHVGAADLGGSTPGEAVKILRARAAEITGAPLRLTYEGRSFQTTLGELGWVADPRATTKAAMAVGRQGLPWSRVWDRALGLVGTVNVPWSASFSPTAVDAVIDGWEDEFGAAPREGSVRVLDGRVVTHAPRPGVGVDESDVLDAASMIAAGIDPERSTLPVVNQDPTTTTADVEAAAARAEELVSDPITVSIRGEELTVRPDEVAPFVRTEVRADAETGPLVLTLLPRGAASLLEPLAEDITVEARNADFRVARGDVKIRPDRPGRVLDGELAASGIVRAGLSRRRAGQVRLAETPAEFTAADAEALGVTDRISTFTTFFPPGEPRVINITLGAAAMDGTVLEPGETFSMNAVLGERTYEKGYVDAPAIVDGQIGEQVGGGISQLTTTAFNAAFFAGYPYLEFKPHSFYFDRYPMGREATLSWTYPDLAFRNDTSTPAFIAADATATSVTVSVYGRRNGRTVKATPPVIVDETQAGYTVELSRLIREGGETSRELFRTYYRNIPEDEPEPPEDKPVRQGPANDQGASNDQNAR